VEIGSIFEIDVEDLFKEGNNEFYLPFMDKRDYIYNKFFNTGRSAIEYLLREVISPKNDFKILLPAFTCSSIIDAVNRAGLNYEFYSITDEFQIDIKSIEKKLDDKLKIIYIIQYFGGYQNQESYDFLKKVQSENIIIIKDITHSLYTKHPKFIGFGDYVLGSLRKWLPIPDGAFLCSTNLIPDLLIEDSFNGYSFNYFVAQVMKGTYLHNTDLNKNQFLRLNQQAMESLFSDYMIRNMTSVSQRYLSSYNMESLIEQRVKNYDYLVEKTKKLSFIKPIFVRQKGQVPFGFVVLCDQRDKVFKYLIDNDIYCNIHWKLTHDCSNTDEVSEKLSKKILTIPCDQRYGKKEMDYIIHVLETYDE